MPGTQCFGGEIRGYWRFCHIAAGYLRLTHDIDLVVDASLENERRFFKALETLPDQCVKELEAGLKKWFEANG